jgi:hypothetical protein
MVSPASAMTRWAWSSPRRCAPTASRLRCRRDAVWGAALAGTVPRSSPWRSTAEQVIPGGLSRMSPRRRRRPRDSRAPAIRIGDGPPGSQSDGRISLRHKRKPGHRGLGPGLQRSVPDHPQPPRMDPSSLPRPAQAAAMSTPPSG